MNSSKRPSPFVSERFSLTFSCSSKSSTTGGALPCCARAGRAAAAEKASPETSSARAGGLVRTGKRVQLEGGVEVVAGEAARAPFHLVEGRGGAHRVGGGAAELVVRCAPELDLARAPGGIEAEAQRHA